MKTESLWKWIVLVLLLAFSAVLISKKDNIRLGLDLQGGYSFTLELDEKALEQEIREKAKEEGKTLSEEEIKAEITRAKDNARDTAVEVVRARIDALGTEEPIITAGTGEDCRIYVQMPGATEEKRRQAESLVRSVAFLRFSLVDEDSSVKAIRLSQERAPRGYKLSHDEDGTACYVRDSDSQVDYTDSEYTTYLRKFGNPKPGTQFMLQKVTGKNGMDYYHPIFVKRKAELTGENLERAKTDINPTTGERYVSLTFDSEGRKKFADITGRNINKRLAIILDDVVYSAPVIQTRIDGEATITGNFSFEEARQLQTVLNAGSLPAPLKFMGERFVSPTLGEDSINASKKAIIFGCLGVLAFLIFYYRRLGIVAAIALILNIILLPAFAVLASNILSTFAQDATASGSLFKLPVLTLPGIAGILLTIGMAVDANVLIFERTREEQAAGRPTFASIMAGYQRAFLAIFDGNLTTIITAIILFVFGTGLIRGFSVTLVAGILASMFTALVVTKLIFQATVKPESKAKIKMMELVPPTVNINFVKRAKACILASVLLIVVLDAVALIRGLNDPSSIFAVDFTGGSKVTFVVENKDAAPLEKIRSSLAKIGIEDAKPQYQSEVVTSASEATLTASASTTEATPAPEVAAAPEVTAEAAPEATAEAAPEVTAEAAPEVTAEAAPAPEATAEAASTSQTIYYLEISTVQTDEIDGKKLSNIMEETLVADMPDAGIRMVLDDTVGSQIGAEMKRTAYIAILLSTIAMLLYITLRFEFGFALGAIVALVHDVLITIGLFTAFGFQFNLTIVAAMLTIVGYGVNDTIVLFDRVREELKQNNKLTFPELANKCINVTLSRTLLTSITTLITVVALMIFTSGDIFSFATCMLIGIIVSTFSTIFIATPVMLAWYKNKRPYFAKK